MRLLRAAHGEPRYDIAMKRMPVGNFSFQHSEINAFDPQTHKLVGTIPIDPGSGHKPGGLWTLTFGGGPNDGSPSTLYFTDGIDGETHGLFGAITSVPLVGTSTPMHSDLAHV